MADSPPFGLDREPQSFIEHLPGGVASPVERIEDPELHGSSSPPEWWARSAPPPSLPSAVLHHRLPLSSRRKELGPPAVEAVDAGVADAWKGAFLHSEWRKAPFQAWAGSVRRR